MESNTRQIDLGDVAVTANGARVKIYGDGRVLTSRAANDAAADARPGEIVPGKGVFLGAREIKDRDGERGTSEWRLGTASAPGTCGELVQGVTGRGEHFHVTCPIRKSSTVTLRMRDANETTVSGLGRELSKLSLAVQRTIEHLDLEPKDVRVEHWSDLDIGKGMGSSTADITAAIRAVAAAADTDVSLETIAAIATSIESSDGSMFPGINAVSQKTGRVLHRFSWYPQFVVTMIVPTNTFNTELADFTGKDQLGFRFDAILDELVQAAENRDAAAFAASASLSSELNQRYLPNPYYLLLKPRAERYGADGIVVGHTGTVAGLLFTFDDRAMEAAVQASMDLEQSLPRDVRIEVTVTPPSPG